MTTSDDLKPSYYECGMTTSDDLKPSYYECGCCGSWHSAEWNGDCREDSARFSMEQLDRLYTPYGWIAVEQAEVDA